MEDKTRSSSPQEGKKERKAEMPSEVDLYGAIEFLKETIVPTINYFDTQIGYFFGPRRGNRPSTPATLRMEKSFRTKWLSEMKPLGVFVELLSKDRNALLVIPAWSCQDEISGNLDQTRVCLIHPKSKGKFEAIVMRDKARERALIDEQKRLPLYVLDVQILKGAGLSRDHYLGYDPAGHKLDEEEEQTTRIRLYPRRIIKDPTAINGFKVENYLGVEIKEMFIHDDNHPRYTVSYIFPETPSLLINDLEAIGISVNKELLDNAINRFEEIAQGVHQIENE